MPSRDWPESDPPPPPSAKDPRRRSYGDLRELGIDDLMRRQRDLLRAESEAAEQRSARRKDEASAQKEAIDRVGKQLEKNELNVDLVEKRLLDIERALATMSGVISFTKWLIPLTFVIATGIASLVSWLFSLPRPHP